MSLSSTINFSDAWELVREEFEKSFFDAPNAVSSLADIFDKDASTFFADADADA